MSRLGYMKENQLCRLDKRVSVLTLAVLLLGVLIPVQSSANIVADKGIPVVDRWPTGVLHELNDQNLTEAVYRFEYALVEFYTSWCKHCKALEPELHLAASRLATLTPPVVVGKLDIEKSPKAKAKYKITKFPTLKLFVGGQTTTYAGPRNASAMVPFLKRQLAPDVEVLQDEGQVKVYLTAHKGDSLAVFLGFGVDPAVLQPVARQHKEHAWFAVHSAASEALMSAHDFDRVPALLAVHADGEQQVFYGPFDDGRDLAEFVRLNYLPPVLVLDEGTFPQVTRSGRPIVLIAANFDAQAPKSMAMDASQKHQVESPGGAAVHFARRCKPVAMRHREYLFVYVDASKYPAFLNAFYIDASTSLPAIVVWNGGTSFYQYDKPEEFHGDDMEFALSNFIQDIDARNIGARATKEPSSKEKVYQVVSHPNFPIAVGLIFLAMCMKLSKKGKNVFLPDLGFVAKKRKEEQEARERLRREQEGAQETEGGRGRGGDEAEVAPDTVRKAEEEKKNN